MFTGYPTYESCVRAVRSGCVGLYREDKDTVGRLALEVVVDSAVEGLCGLDLQQELEQRIPAWFGAHSSDMQLRYCGQLVAIWWQPEVHVIASGKDAFELEERLESWRALHEPWEKPFICRYHLVNLVARPKGNNALSDAHRPERCLLERLRWCCRP